MGITNTQVDSHSKKAFNGLYHVNEIFMTFLRKRLIKRMNVSKDALLEIVQEHLKDKLLPITSERERTDVKVKQRGNWIKSEPEW